jgi:PD-(D/E)XK endonuclease
MEKKSRFVAVGPAGGPKSPVRNHKRRGEIVEIAFMHKAADMGFAVTKPYGDSEAYDFIVDSGSRLWRVQVKSCAFRKGLTYQLRAAHHSGNIRAAGPYTADQIDFLAVYIMPVGVWYMIPVNAFTPSTCLCLLPHLPVAAGKYEQFREAWHLLACKRKGKLRTGLVTSPECDYSGLIEMWCTGCEGE